MRFRGAWKVPPPARLRNQPVRGCFEFRRGLRERLDRPIGDLEAANAFRNTVVPSADGYCGNGPMWHRWAIFDAFLAGMDYARQTTTRDDIESQSPGWAILSEEDNTHRR